MDTDLLTLNHEPGLTTVGPLSTHEYIDYKVEQRRDKARRNAADSTRRERSNLSIDAYLERTFDEERVRNDIKRNAPHRYIEITNDTTPRLNVTHDIVLNTPDPSKINDYRFMEARYGRRRETTNIKLDDDTATYVYTVIASRNGVADDASFIPKEAVASDELTQAITTLQDHEPAVLPATIKAINSIFRGYA
jgi:hypothetical protein